MLMLNGVFTETAELVDLVFDVRQFPGVLQVLLPPPLSPKDPKKQAKGFRIGSKTNVAKWQKTYVKAAERLFHEAKYPIEQYRLLTESMKKVAAQVPLVLNGARIASIRALQIAANDRHAIFLRIDPPAKAKPGSKWSFDVSQRNTKTGQLLGGSRYQVVVNQKG